VSTGPQPRRLPKENAKQAELTRTADEMIERNPAQSGNPEEPTQYEDEWAAVIRNYAYGRDRVYMGQVGMHVSNKFELGKFGKKEQLRIGKVFVAMDWRPFHTKIGRGYEPRPSPSFAQNIGLPA
jgi:hypothetical protein